MSEARYVELPYTHRRVRCETTDEFFRVLKWVAWVDKRRIDSARAEQVRRLADQSWRTQGRAEAERVR